MTGIRETTFTNGLGELLGPVLVLVRSTGFFEAHVFIPLMTAASVPLFVGLTRSRKLRAEIEGMTASARRLWWTMYYSLCFLATNVTAVAFKTLILEELDYDGDVWYAAFVGPMHFYILSVVLAYLWLISRPCGPSARLALGIHVQIGLIGGYATGVHRLLHEPFDPLDPTSGVSGAFFLVWFAGFHWDVMGRTLPARPPWSADVHSVESLGSRSLAT